MGQTNEFAASSLIVRQAARNPAISAKIEDRRQNTEGGPYAANYGELNPGLIKEIFPLDKYNYSSKLLSTDKVFSLSSPEQDPENPCPAAILLAVGLFFETGAVNRMKPYNISISFWA